ncbi:MAG: hypothetical protein P8Y44_03485 [Acidobacteriota bacterium]
MDAPGRADIDMDKREDKRLKRRFQVRFWRLDDPVPKSGFTYNISLTGMFICTNSPFKPGTQIVIEVGREGRKVELHARVMHAARVDPVLQKVKPSGMGVRLMRTEEMMAAVLGLNAVAEEEDTVEDESVAEPEEAEELEATEESEASEEEEEEPPPLYYLNFVSPRELATSFERDLKFGGIFVPTSRIPDRDRVVVEFLFDWNDITRIRIPAHVVKRFEAAEGSARGEHVAGIGVAFDDPEGAIEEFLDIVDSAATQQ